jgi:hypothetical protein
MMNFIYTPRSGDRTFAKKECPQVISVQYVNSSYHVFGGVRLEFTACLPGRAYWRDSAKVMAKMVVGTYGGVAWDDKGVVIMIVPEAAAKQALGLMGMAREAHTTYSPDGNRVVANDAVKNHLTCGMVGWEVMPTSGPKTVEDMVDPICPVSFSLGAFNGGKEKIFGNPKDIFCRKSMEGEAPGFFYSLGDCIWSSPWEVKGLPAWEVPVMEEAPASVAAVRAPLIVD